MALIKNLQAREIIGTAVVMNLGDVRREADEILEQARRDAERIVEEARAEARELVDGAAERGHAEGFARGGSEGRVAGIEEGRREGFEAAEASHSPRLAAVAEGWDQALQAFLAGRDQLREEARRDLLRLSIAIAERVLGRLPEHDPSIVTEQVEAAVGMLSGATRLRVRVHPEDQSIIETHFARTKGMIGAASDVDVVMESDPEVVRGGCLVSAGDGEVDARLDAQMSRIVKGLFPELLESSDAPPPPAPSVPPSATAADVAATTAPVEDSASSAPDETVATDPTSDSWDEIAPQTGSEPPEAAPDGDEPQ
ncbi:MAG: hypothetical protein CMJ34_11770 [Phycisphaerae bacterium]|nr:hypothetical protein [Phycisphaerae bacterium]